MIRVLLPSDAAVLERFLADHAAASMILRSNAAQSGIVDGTTAYHGLYAAAFENDAITDVAAHYWNGMIALQSPHRPAAVVAALVAASQRHVAGLLGPWRQCQAAADALRLPGKLKAARPEILYALEAGRVRVPEPLTTGALTCRRAENLDLELMVRWRAAYEVELLGSTPGAANDARAAETMTRHVGAGDFWLALQDGRPVSMAGISARAADMIQFGGVYTPRENRGRKFGRVAVAGALLAVRAGGVRQAILFTGVENIPAQRSYESLGFERVGDYGMMLAKD